MQITWKKEFFSDLYELFSNDQKLGEIEDGMFKTRTRGFFNESKLLFKKKGYFSSDTEIIDQTTNETIGSIRFGSWGTKAEIKLIEEEYQWKYDNFLSSKWSIHQGDKHLMTYSSGFTSGKIEVNENADKLILTGLNVHNHFMQIGVFIAISVCLLTAIN